MDHCVYKGQSRLSIRSAACRLPGTWDVGVWFCVPVGPDFNTEVPAWRWYHDEWFDPDPGCWRGRRTFCRHASFMDGVELFDSRFFGITVPEAELMDPRQRHLLEVGYEAMHRAGYSKASLLRCAGGIYVGATNQLEWGSVQTKVAPHAVTGRAASVMAGRLSYALGLKGPSLALDAGGCAGLCGVALAAEAMRSQATVLPTAFSCCLGAAILVSPQNWWQAQAAGLLSASGRCRTFDASADGYTEGDGAAAALLQNLEEAVDGTCVAADADLRLGMLASAAVNHTGMDASMCAPSCASECELLQDAMLAAAISPRHVDAVEGDGRSFVVGDAVELIACTNCFCEEERNFPLVVSCVKSHVGNVDGAAGIIGLIRCVMAISRGAQTATVHLSCENPLSGLSQHTANIADEALAFQRYSAYAGVSSFGCGTNVHALAFGVITAGVAQQEGLTGSRRVTLAFWPGGGGALGPHEKPDRAYFIKGSWSRWEEAELMQDEGGGCFGFTAVLGVAGWETFQIWLDGDPCRVLFPPTYRAGQGTQVCGPGSDSDGRCWLIDAYSSFELPAPEHQEQGLRMQLHESAESGGRPGDRYHIQVQVAGKWRKIHWHRLEPDGLFDTLGLWPLVHLVPAIVPPLAAQRSYDIVLYGATGFTGRLCASYLANVVASSAEPGVRSLRIALAGRNMDRLLAVQREHAPGCPLIAVQGDDKDGLLNLASATHVCISAAGPFMKYSRHLVEACSQSGTDYADINGEAPFVRYLIDHCNAMAATAGAFIVPNCGFDCVPSDMGCFTALDLLKRASSSKHKSSSITVRAYMDIRGVVSGGTIASGIMVSEDPLLERQAADPFLLGGSSGAKPGVSHEDASEARFDDRVLCWTAPLEMSRVNSRVVRRSQQLFALQGTSRGGSQPYPAVFSYREVALAPSEAAALRMAAPMPSVEERRSLVQRGQLPAPGEGPDAKTRAGSSFEARHVAECDEDPDATRVAVAVSGGDPGYTETSKMLVEAAIILALRHQGYYPPESLGCGERGGVFTPAFAFGHIYTRRLHLAGITFRRVDPTVRAW